MENDGGTVGTGIGTGAGIGIGIGWLATSPLTH